MDVYAGTLSIMLASKIYDINILVFEYRLKYKGYKQTCKFIKQSQIKPILLLQYKDINKIGHYNVLDIKNNYQI